MDSCLIVHPKAYSKVHVFYSIIFIGNIIALCLMTINYCLSAYSLKYYEEEDPNIDLTGISSFSFRRGYIDEYSPGESNLGTTGKLFFNCYTGSCTYRYDYKCTRRECRQVKKTDTYYYDDDDDEDQYETVCEDVETTCTTYDTYEEYSCSKDCRKSKQSSCGSGYCNSNSRGYYSSSKCRHDDDSDDYGSSKSCTADNIIYNWRNYYYSRNNASYYGMHKYLDSAVPANETCPAGKKQCGILDNLGNKLCYNENEECPINHVTLKKPESNLHYQTEVVDGVTIYYTNEANETGRVLGGFFVDSDLLLKYNNEDCEIIATSTISSLLYSHSSKLYRKSIGFNPYNDKNIDKKGKSYLKWCIPGYGKEKNISKIKELTVVYRFNISQNEQYVKPIKTKYITGYFVALPGYIGTFLFFVALILSFHRQNNINTKIKCRCLNSSKNMIIIIGLAVSFFLIILGSIFCLVNNSQIATARQTDTKLSIFSLLHFMNIICFIVNILLIILTIGFFIYVMITPRTLLDSYRTNENDGNKKNEDLRNLADFKNNPDFADFTDAGTPLVDDYPTKQQVNGVY